jgi:hypothetical protein
MGKKIYVETNIKAPIESVWNYTQTPQLHQQWDLRFSEITYLPKAHEQDRQKFLYKTNIGFGLSIAGEGESYGTKEVNGVRTSSLMFGTEQRISLIEQGSGFWRYIPTKEGVTFLTLYDYRTRFGLLGKYFDTIVFRPLIGWATAWSFDALRLWLEQGIHPRSSLFRCLRYWLITIVLCFLWCYQGLVPKLLFAHTGELALITELGLFHGFEQKVLITAGVLEIVFGLMFLFIRNKSKLLHLSNIIVLMGLMLSGLAFPSIYIAPFNPITLNVAMMTLSAISLLEREPLANAGHCLRIERKEQSTEKSK